jgi:hypothetical protein
MHDCQPANLVAVAPRAAAAAPPPRACVRACCVLHRSRRRRRRTGSPCSGDFVRQETVAGAAHDIKFPGRFWNLLWKLCPLIREEF